MIANAEAAPRAKRSGLEKASGVASQAHIYPVCESVATADFPTVWINDGTTCLGRIFAAGKRFRAVAGDDRPLGTFACMGEARRAIMAAASGDLLARIKRDDSQAAKQDRALVRQIRARAAACRRAAS